MHRSSYRSSDKTAKHSLFLPPEDNELSVYRINDLSEDAVVQIGQDYVASPQNKRVVGFAQLHAERVFAQGLNLIPTQVPHPRHANIVGWDSSAKLSKAQILAAHAELFLRVS